MDSAGRAFTPRTGGSKCGRLLERAESRGPAGSGLPGDGRATAAPNGARPRPAPAAQRLGGTTAKQALFLALVERLEMWWVGAARDEKKPNCRCSSMAFGGSAWRSAFAAGQAPPAGCFGRAGFRRVAARPIEQRPICSPFSTRFGNAPGLF